VKQGFGPRSLLNSRYYEAQKRLKPRGQRILAGSYEVITGNETKLEVSSFKILNLLSSSLQTLSRSPPVDESTRSTSLTLFSFTIRS